MGIHFTNKLRLKRIIDYLILPKKGLKMRNKRNYPNSSQGGIHLIKISWDKSLANTEKEMRRLQIKHSTSHSIDNLKHTVSENIDTNSNLQNVSVHKPSVSYLWM